MAKTKGKTTPIATMLMEVPQRKLSSPGEHSRVARIVKASMIHMRIETRANTTPSHSFCANVMS